MASDGMTNTTPTDLQARMEKLVRDIASYQYHVPLALESEALAIVAELRKPIDPDVLAVREILGAAAESSEREWSIKSGNEDQMSRFKDALAAYKRIKADRA